MTEILKVQKCWLKIKDDKAFYEDCSVVCRSNYETSLYTEKNFVPYITDIFEGLDSG